MTISSDKAMSGPYFGNGQTKNFNYQFKIFDKKHLQVLLHKADGVVEHLVEGNDYTVVGVGADGGGEIVLNVAPATGEQLTIIRSMPFVQEMDLENQGAFYAEVVEQAFDEAAMRDQQLKEKLDRAITVPENVAPEAKDELVRDIVRLGESADNIDKLVPIRQEIADMAAIAANINAVAGNAGNITTIASHIDDVTTVAGYDVPAIIDAHEYAHQWAVKAENQTVNDGTNPSGYSAYHWAQKAAASAAEAGSIAGGNFLPLSGGTVTGALTVNSSFYANNAQFKHQVYIGSNIDQMTEINKSGNIKGNIWKDWHSNGWAFDAIRARIEARSKAIADERINALVNNMIDAKINAFRTNKPVFVGMVKVIGGIKAVGIIKAGGNIEAFTPASQIDEEDEE